MKLMISVIITILSLSGLAHGQKSSPSAMISAKSQTSQENRKGKFANISSHVGVFTMGGTLQDGFTLDFFLNTSNVIELEYSNLYASWDTVRVRGLALSAAYKIFLGNSFYIKAGPEFRQVRYQYTDSLDGNLSKFAGNSFAMVAAIGNQWQWENFSLGCEWVGFRSSFKTDFTSESTPNDPFFNQSKFDNDKETYLTNAQNSLARLYVGYSF